MIALLITLIFIGVILMAQASAILSKQAEVAAAIAALATRIGDSSGITIAESDEILANEEANLAAVEAIAPAP